MIFPILFIDVVNGRQLVLEMPITSVNNNCNIAEMYTLVGARSSASPMFGVFSI